MTNEITIITPEHVELKFELAGLGSRFLALFIDTLIQVLFVVSAGIIVSFIVGLNVYWMDSLSVWIYAVFILLIFAFWGGYFLYFEVMKNGQTPGKMSVGIRVVRDTGHPIDFRSSLLRNAMRAVDVLPGLYGIGFISVFLSPEYRRLGDYVAGTLVVKTRQKPQAASTLTMPEDFDLDGVPTPTSPIFNSNSTVQPLLPPEVLPYLNTITRDDYRAIRHFLDRRPELEDGLARSLAAKIAAPLAKKLQIDPDSLEDPINFLTNLGGEWERRMIH